MRIISLRTGRPAFSRLSFLTRGLLFTLLLISGLLLGVYMLEGNSAYQDDGQGAIVVPAGKIARAFHSLGVSTTTLQRVLEQGLPVAFSGNMSDTYHRPGDMVQSAAYAIARVDVQDPRSLLNSQLPVLANAISSNPVESQTLEDENTDSGLEGPQLFDTPSYEPEDPAEASSVNQGPLVAIYNTHNAESYIPSGGKDKDEGQNGGVVKLASGIARTLEEHYSVPTVQSETIHDYPSFPMSYQNSAKTVQEILRKNPSVKIVMDIHRDAGIDKKQVIKVDEREAAKILFIVGSDTRLDHPNWKKNWDFARQVAAKMDSLYPGLSKGVRVQSGRYNQNLHPRAILVEVGSAYNSLEEAAYTGELLARVISEVLKDMNKKA
ncbi:MAG: stage II sporulation protein P [Bacillota bacterium]